jgi:hypothetical protein
LHFAEDNLNLIEPAAILRQPEVRTTKESSSEAIQAPSCLGACVGPLSRIRFSASMPLQMLLANKPSRNSEVFSKLTVPHE